MTAIPCKICGEPAPLHGVVDFNKSCEAHRGKFFELAGEPVWYHRCTGCGFLFTPHFDGWTPTMWCALVYNAEYHLFDPDGADGSRARANAALVLALFPEVAKQRLLDFGGGNGALADRLRLNGIDCLSYDPMNGDPPPVEFPTYGIITAFEVFEHTTTPIETARQALSMLREGGVLAFSTLVCDGLPQQACDWFYLSPRNGHVSIHTIKSLDLMFAAQGFQVRHLSNGLHVAQKS